MTEMDLKRIVRVSEEVIGRWFQRANSWGDKEAKELALEIGDRIVKESIKDGSVKV